MFWLQLSLTTLATSLHLEITEAESLYLKGTYLIVILAPKQSTVSLSLDTLITNTLRKFSHMSPSLIALSP